MAGVYHDDYQQFDTMNLSAPQRGGEAANRLAGGAPDIYHASGGGDFDTTNLSAPHRGGREAAAQFNTANLGAPVKMPMNNNSQHGGGGAMFDGREGGGRYSATAPPPSYNQHSGQSPMMVDMSGGNKTENGGQLQKGLVIAMLVLRVAATLSLIVGLAVLASDSQTINSVTVTYRASSSTKYALATSILGAVYSIYELVSVSVRLITGSLLLPGTASLWVSYIGDQVIVVLLLTGASAGASFIKSMHDFPVSSGDATTYCDVLNSFCNQGAGAIAMIYIGFVFIAASLVISSYAFYKKKT